MGTPLPTRHNFHDGLIPSGTLWLPRASLSACVRGSLVRNTVGTRLNDAQRLNHFPAAPLCSLSWWFAGSSLLLQAEPSSAVGLIDTLSGPHLPMPGRWVLSGPQTRPVSTWCPGPVYGMMVLFMPDALHLLTGLEAADLIDRFVDATGVLSSDWLAMCQQVQDAPNDAQRMALLEDFLEPRWSACRGPAHRQALRYADWVTHLAQRAAVSGPGRSLRQFERRVKRWAGLPLRELRGMARAEQAFFEAAAAQAHEGSVRWADLAADSGFADQSHLCRVTHRFTGFSPEALRRGIETEEPFWSYRLWL